MASATNRTEMLAKALMRARLDFTLHNARVFARAVIDAPESVFGAKPLRFLPNDTDGDGPVRFVLDEFTQAAIPHRDVFGAETLGTVPQPAPRPLPDPLGDWATRQREFNRHCIPVPAGAAFFRNVEDVSGSLAPVSPAEAKPGDIVTVLGGGHGLYVGNGQMQAPSIATTKSTAAEYDPSKPNHFFVDALGDPDTCRGNHNHPEQTNETHISIAVQLEREMKLLSPPSPHPLPTAPPSARERAAFPLGVGATGEPVTYSPAADGHLLVFGGAGRGKSMLVRGLVRDALATNWWGARHLNSRKDPDAVLDQIRGIHAEIEIRRANPKLHKPELLALDDALWAYFDAAQREELHTLVTELLSIGRELGLHLVLITLTLDNDERFPSRWLDLCSTVLLTSKPTHDDAVKVMGDDAAQLPPSGWDGSGKMLLVRRLTGVSRPQPLCAYTQADKYQGY
ncbi:MULTISPECIES: FtsK/SpoIIIE domain-containing protein [Mycobacteroides]|uniref:ATP-binding protein n=1 Tax=Mycobacteroides TaxID=670516 RepID=UPI000713CF22|nr:MULTISPECIES: ATP-binding protein [Mycobacteroides]KRQ24257.1 ATP-binding protein [Mycobacteroides sp. H092]KRQ26004.1 ATP-binding protein [Mycobacteroides sp. H003]KRQ39332.1 ATP-binding protein [Mycobacteroides sp. H101]KRQ48709.1 ATP-binding protein [Mycobacteroides sp. H063]KRQ58743.1 ATP-binding protein [Mycobacteroides sp. HXVII]